VSALHGDVSLQWRRKLAARGVQLGWVDGDSWCV